MSSSATILVADDSPTMRRIVSSVLSRDGYDVVTAEDGMTAVQAVFRHQPDAAVIDVSMPRLSGYVIARLLREDWASADIPVILLTGLDAASERYWGGKAGAARFLTKDFEAPELTSAIAEVLDTARHARGGGERLRPDPVELSEQDVLDKALEVLDRTLFQTSVAAEVTNVAATVSGFEETVAALLELVGRVVDQALAGVVLVQERSAWLAASRPISEAHLGEFLDRATEAAAGFSGLPITSESVTARVADPNGLLGADEEAELATFLSMPLRGSGGAIIGVLALSSEAPDAFGDAACTTLRLLEGPVALVVDNARLTRDRLVGARVGEVGPVDQLAAQLRGRPHVRDASEWPEPRGGLPAANPGWGPLSAPEWSSLDAGDPPPGSANGAGVGGR